MRGEYLGLFAHHLHITPNEVDELTVRDFIALVEWIDRHESAISAAAKAVG